MGNTGNDVSAPELRWAPGDAGRWEAAGRAPEGVLGLVTAPELLSGENPPEFWRLGDGVGDLCAQLRFGDGCGEPAVGDRGSRNFDGVSVESVLGESACENMRLCEGAVPCVVPQRDGADAGDTDGIAFSPNATADP